MYVIHRGVLSHKLFCDCRKNHQRQLEALQHSVEEETRGKAEQARQKKAMEEQLNELQSSIDEAQKVHNIPSFCVYQSYNHSCNYILHTTPSLNVTICTHTHTVIASFPGSISLIFSARITCRFVAFKKIRGYFFISDLHHT